MGSGGCATSVGQEGAGEDAHLPKAGSRGNSLEGSSVLKLGERGKKVAGGRKENKVMVLKFCFLHGLQQGQVLRCAVDSSVVLVYKEP